MSTVANKDDLFRKKQRERQRRKEENRRLAPSRYLIVCEGKKTEPNYFKGIEARINSEYNSRISVDSKIELSIDGTGRNTNDLVEYVKKLVNRSPLGYGHVWIIYDKDDFSDDQFNSSIQQAENSCGYHVGWSNEAVELWFILHFEYLNSGISREMYCEKLSKHFERLGLGKYEKNRSDIFEILMKNGNVKKAIERARKLLKVHNEGCISSPAKMKPATTVYELVCELLKYIE